MKLVDFLEEMLYNIRVIDIFGFPWIYNARPRKRVQSDTSYVLVGGMKPGTLAVSEVRERPVI